MVPGHGELQPVHLHGLMGGGELNALHADQLEEQKSGGQGNGELLISSTVFILEEACGEGTQTKRQNYYK